MYIVAIAWLYVTLLMAATERNAMAGVMTFLAYGFVPLALLLWLLGGPRRRRRRVAGDDNGASAAGGAMEGGDGAVAAARSSATGTPDPAGANTGGAGDRGTG